MFVHYLDERQQAALLHYAREVMVADSAIDPEESLQMEVLRGQVRPGVQSEAVPMEQLRDLFSDRPRRVILLMELLGMAYANEDFVARESKMINEIAGTLMDTDILKTIESWVRRQLSLLKEAQELMEV